jgi:hypothetical protein
MEKDALFFRHHLLNYFLQYHHREGVVEYSIDLNDGDPEDPPTPPSPVTSRPTVAKSSKQTKSTKTTKRV